MFSYDFLTNIFGHVIILSTLCFLMISLLISLGMYIITLLYACVLLSHFVFSYMLNFFVFYPFLFQLRQLVHGMLQRNPADRPSVDKLVEVVKQKLSSGLANYHDLGIVGRG